MLIYFFILLTGVCNALVKDLKKETINKFCVFFFERKFYFEIHNYQDKKKITLTSYEVP